MARLSSQVSRKSPRPSHEILRPLPYVAVIPRNLLANTANLGSTSKDENMGVAVYIHSAEKRGASLRTPLTSVCVPPCPVEWAIPGYAFAALSNQLELARLRRLLVGLSRAALRFSCALTGRIFLATPCFNSRDVGKRAVESLLGLGGAFLPFP